MNNLLTLCGCSIDHAQLLKLTNFLNSNTQGRSDVARPLTVGESKEGAIENILLNL